MQNSMLEDRRQPAEGLKNPLLAMHSQDLGNVYEHIDPYTLEIISKLLPSSGLEFLGRLLQHATIVQNVLPDLEALGERVAVINTRTIRILAKAIRWGYDTTHKYVSVFISLGLLYRHKHSTGNILVFPIKRYELLSSLHALDNLVTQSRPKVRQFARKVKERLLLYNLISQVDQSVEARSGPSECDANLHRMLLGSMVEVIKSEGIDTARGKHIALRLMSEVINKIVFPSQTVTEAQKKRSATILPEQTSANQRYTLESHNNTTRQYQSESSFRAKENSNPSKVSAQRRPAQTEVSHSVEKESTQKGDFPLQSSESTSGGRPVQAEVSHSVEKESTQKGDFPRQSSVTASDGRPVQAKVSYPIEKESTQKGDFIINLLTFYHKFLESEEINWEQIALPKSFFEVLYTQLHSHYQRLHKGGILSFTKEYMWVSIEANIIKKLAANYRLHGIETCRYVFKFSGREYQPDVEIQQHCYTSTEETYQPDADIQPYRYTPTEKTYQPDANNEHETAVDEYQFNVNRSQATRVDQYQSEVDRYHQESTNNMSTRKTLDDAQVTDDNQVYPDSQAEGYSRFDESTSAIDYQADEENPADAAQQAERQRHLEAFIASCQPVDKPARIPAEVDPEDYLEAFYYVLRNRNIYLLFNKIHKDDTLRSSGAHFLTTVFDNKDGNKKNSLNVKKQNESLLTKYDPKVIVRGFIDTVLTMHEPGHDSLQNPGAFFTSRCKYYLTHEPDLETDELIDRYANLTYSNFVEEMHDLINSGHKIRTKKYKKKF